MTAVIPHSAARKFSVKKGALETSYCTSADFPDFSADWKLIEPASNAEIEARFYYEFARESETILRLTERLSHERGPLKPLFYFSFRCFKIVQALVPGEVLGSSATRRSLNLREISWNQLKPQQREAIASAFRPDQAAFREFGNQESFSFDPAKDHGIGYYERFPVCSWSGSSRLDFNGIENLPIKIDWSQGSQAVKSALKEWFTRHKKELLRLKSKGELPMGGQAFQLRVETGAKTPKRKYVAALRGLGAMRLLGSQTLREAINITKGSLYSSDVRSRSAWNVGVNAARQTFQELFCPLDEHSLGIRHCNGLPQMEEPISYRRYCRRRENK